MQHARARAQTVVDTELDLKRRRGVPTRLNEGGARENKMTREEEEAQRSTWGLMRSEVRQVELWGRRARTGEEEEEEEQGGWAADETCYRFGERDRKVGQVPEDKRKFPVCRVRLRSDGVNFALLSGKRQKQMEDRERKRQKQGMKAQSTFHFCTRATSDLCIHPRRTHTAVRTHTQMYVLST